MASLVTNGSHTPLRYPGGKGKLTKFVAHTLSVNNISGTYIEPFAGGAGIAINLLLCNQVENIIINDLDDGVYAFWITLVRNPSSLISKIQDVPFDTKDGITRIGGERAYWFWKTVKTRYAANKYSSIEDKAFDFFLLNRMNVSGIIKAGLIGGVSQLGTYNISSRFNKKSLISRIENIADVRHHIQVTRRDGTKLLAEVAEKELCDLDNCFVFFDPPYYVQGRNLYTTFAPYKIHSLLERTLSQEQPWKWILTYDVAPEILELYKDVNAKRYRYQLSYSAYHHGHFNEYMFADPRINIDSFDKVNLLPLDD